MLRRARVRSSPRRVHFVMRTRYPISTPRRVVHTRRRARIAMACPLRKYVAMLSVVAALFAAVFAFFARPETPDVDYVVPNDASGATEAAGSETPEEAVKGERVARRRSVRSG